MLMTLSTLGCSRPLSMDDVLGEWETKTVNGVALPGTVGFTTVLGTIDSVRFEYEHWSFLEEGGCVATSQVDDEVRTIDETNCRYEVDLGAGSIVVRLYDYGNLPGTIDRSAITLLADDQYAWVLHRRK
jgi:hypothetical protein